MAIFVKANAQSYRGHRCPSFRDISPSRFGMSGSQMPSPSRRLGRRPHHVLALCHQHQRMEDQQHRAWSCRLSRVISCWHYLVCWFRFVMVTLHVWKSTDVVLGSSQEIRGFSLVCPSSEWTLSSRLDLRIVTGVFLRCAWPLCDRCRYLLWTYLGRTWISLFVEGSQE